MCVSVEMLKAKGESKGGVGLGGPTPTLRDVEIKPMTRLRVHSAQHLLMLPDRRFSWMVGLS